MLRTRLTELLGLQYPVVSAPMTGHSGGRLAGAVSKAGGLGSFGGIDPQGPEWVSEQAALVREQTDRPFCVGFITPFIPMTERNFEAALEAKTPVIAFSFSDPQPWLARAKAAGAVTMCQAQTMEGAREAVAAGTDILVAQGNEAGGHTGRMAMLPFLSRLIEEFPDVPVLAAGGIGGGRELAAALAAGADGVWMGTVFLATPEAVEVPDVYKRLVVESDGQDTEYTRVYDLIDGLPWPEGIAGRVYRNAFVREWHGRDEEIVRRREELAGRTSEAYRKDPEVAAVYMGQSAGQVRAVRPAGDVLRDVCDEAERILRARQGLLD